MYILGKNILNIKVTICELCVLKKCVKIGVYFGNIKKWDYPKFWQQVLIGLIAWVNSLP